MKLIASGTTKATLVVLVVMALLFVGLSAFAYPSLSSNDGTSETDSESDTSNSMLTAASDGESKQGTQESDDPGILPLFRLHATPIDGDGDGLADDVIIYASTMDFRPLGGVMIYIDGIYRGATSFEGWLFAMDFAPGYHRVRGLHYQNEAFTSFWIQGIVQPKYGALKGVVFGEDPTGPTHKPVSGALVEIFRPYPYTIPYPIPYPSPFPYPIEEVTDRDAFDNMEKYDDAGEVHGDHDSDETGATEAQGESLRYYASTTTDRNGEFSFEKVPAGRLMMRVRALGYNGHSQIIGITAGQTTFVKVVLRPILPGALNGIVLNGDPNGHVIAPIPGARVEIFSPYPVPYPKPSPMPVPMEVMDFDLEGEEYLAGANSKAGLDITASGSRGDNSEPINEQIIEPAVQYYDFRITDENGEFSFDKVPAGTYMMRVSARGFHPYNRLVTIKGGEVTSVRVLLKPVLPGVLKGTVLEDDPNGHVITPIAGAKVEIFTPYLKPAISVADTTRDESMPGAKTINDNMGEGTNDDIGSISNDGIGSVTYGDIGPAVLYYDVRYTNDDGTFVFEKVPEGKYAIRVSADGYLQFRGFVKIVEGETTELRIKLKPVTWGALKGLVYEDDPNGPSIKPIQGALVEIYSPYPYPLPLIAEANGVDTDTDADLLGLWTPFDGTGLCHSATIDDCLLYYAKTRTDENGEFSFERVPAGIYVIRVTADGYESHRGKVRIEANEVTYVRIPLTRITTGILTGIVLGEDPTGPAIKPIAGAKVEIFTPIPTPFPTEEELWNIEASSSAAGPTDEQPTRMPVWYYDHTFTGDNGAFEFPEVPEGTYMMRVTAPGWHGHTELVTIKANEITRVRVMLNPIITGRLEGTVYGEEWAGGPINPVGNALVVIWNQWHVQFTRTDKSGGFFMDEVPEGKYVLYVFAGGFWPYKEEVKIHGNEVTYTRIILRPVVEKGHLNGNVYGEKWPGGQIVPVEGAKLKLLNHGNTFQGTTNEDGEFTFEFVPEGDYILYVEAEGWRPYKEEVTIRGGQTTYTRILLKPAPRYGSLVGVVLERGGGQIAGPAKVTLFNQWYMESTITDRSGNFQFEKVPAGTYWLHVTAENYEERTIKVEILPGQTTEIKIELEPLGISDLP